MFKRFVPSGKVVCLLVIMSCQFGAGVLMERKGWLPRTTQRPPAEARDSLVPFWETWNLIEKHYVDRQAVQPDRLAKGAIKGMLDTLEDVGHTYYLTPEEFARFEREVMSPGQQGIRMNLRKGLTIVELCAGERSLELGLRNGDRILEVNHQSIRGLSLKQIEQLVNRENGEQVHLRIQRDEDSEPRDLFVGRKQVDVPAVSAWRFSETPIVHIALRTFHAQTHEQLKTALEQARRQHARGLILDVRGNSGGLMRQCLDVTSEFLKDGNILWKQDAQGRFLAVPVEPGGSAVDLPLCVLIDGNTASSAEIFASALQDHDRATLVGTKTCGTGTTMFPFRLSDGSVVMLSVYEWLTPRGRRLWRQGITPDVEVALPEGAERLAPDAEIELTPALVAQKKDAQLQKAFEILSKMIK